MRWFKKWEYSMFMLYHPVREKNPEPRRSLEFQCAHGKKNMIYELQMTIFPKPSIRFAIRLNRCVPCHLINKTRPLLAYFSAKNIMRAPRVITSQSLVQSKYNLIHQTKHHLEPSYPTNQTKSCIILSHQSNTILVSSHPGRSHPICTILSHSTSSHQPTRN